MPILLLFQEEVNDNFDQSYPYEGLYPHEDIYPGMISAQDIEPNFISGGTVYSPTVNQINIPEPPEEPETRTRFPWVMLTGSGTITGVGIMTGGIVTGGRVA